MTEPISHHTQPPERDTNESPHRKTAKEILMELKNRFPRLTRDKLLELFGKVKNTQVQEGETLQKSEVMDGPDSTKNSENEVGNGMELQNIQTNYYTKMIPELKGNDGKYRRVYTEEFKSDFSMDHKIHLIDVKTPNDAPEYKTTAMITISDKFEEEMQNFFSSSNDVILELPGPLEKYEFVAKEIRVDGVKIIYTQGFEKGDNRVTQTMKNTLLVEMPDQTNGQIVIEFLRNYFQFKEEDTETIVRQAYLLQNKKEVNDDELDGIINEEVYPGYSTYLQKGRYKELFDKVNGFVFRHSIIGTADPEVISNRVLSVCESGGLLSAVERIKRDTISPGNSIKRDMKVGGGNGVFTSLLSGEQDGSVTCGPVTFIISPKVYDRLDWFAYPRDSYGASPLNTYEARQTPEEAVRTSKYLTASEKPNGFGTQEQAFSYGIGLSDILFVVCKYEEQRNAIIEKLKANGIIELNNKPIEQWVQLTQDNSNGEILDLAKVFLEQELV